MHIQLNKMRPTLVNRRGLILLHDSRPDVARKILQDTSICHIYYMPLISHPLITIFRVFFSPGYDDNLHRAERSGGFEERRITS